MQHGILMKGNRAIIPSVLRLEVLEKVHTYHQGIQKCHERAKRGAWWPGLSEQVEDIVKEYRYPTSIQEWSQSCRSDYSNQTTRPLMAKVGTDLLDWTRTLYDRRLFLSILRNWRPTKVNHTRSD